MSEKAFYQRRQDFPALGQKVHGHPLVYLDSAATSLKPNVVLEAMHSFNSLEAANVHRGAHYLSDRATEKFEKARQRVQSFLNAADEREIVFTSGTTDSINLVAQTVARQSLKAGDEILITEMEHHSNIVPWQILERDLGVVLKWAPLSEAGELDLEAFRGLLTEKVKLVSVTYASNALGTVNPVGDIVKMAHGVGALVMIDAAQAVTFENIDVQALDCDFLSFSAHKIYGPFGTGVLYGKLALLEAARPARGGGATISKVTQKGVSFLGSPQKFEAGTPNVVGVIGLAAALDYVSNIGLDAIRVHERSLVHRTTERLIGFEGFQPFGVSPTRVNVVSFNIQGLHPSDIGQILDQQGVAVRSGHHCTQPLMDRFGVSGTLRVSFGVYNSVEDVDIFLAALKKAQGMLR